MMTLNRVLVGVLLVVLGGVLHFALAQQPTAPAGAGVTIDDDATIHLPPISVPFSEFASAEAKASFLRVARFYQQRAVASTIADQRKSSNLQMQPALNRTRALYPANSVLTVIGGVETEVITPKDGIAPRNEHRVLINLHGGAFLLGAHIIGPIESMPLASLGKIKVVSVEYRQGPENHFPAASEDVAAVYRELLKTYKPQNIGIYGCSAGGVLTAEVTVWIAQHNLPRPGAIGIFCASAGGWQGGDSATLALPLTGINPEPDDTAPPHPSISNAAYFINTNFNDPAVEPLHFPAVLAQFPPTLIITSTRDTALSPAVYTHSQLVKLGVDAELHVWEGLFHGFFTTDPDLPESREVWDVATHFFDRHLGTN